MRGFCSVIARFESSVTLVKRSQTASAALGSPTVSTQTWDFQAAVLPVKKETDQRTAGNISAIGGRMRLYARLDAVATRAPEHVIKETIANLDIQSKDEIIVEGISYLIENVVRYDRRIGFLVANLARKPVAGGV